MPFSDKQFRRIKCDAPGCDKDVEFDLSDIKAIQAIEWLKGVRVVQTGDNRNKAYCSDVCEVKGVTTGEHNVKEPKPQPQVKLASSEAEIKQAVVQAAGEAATTEALKTGQGEAKIII